MLPSQKDRVSIVLSIFEFDPMFAARCLGGGYLPATAALVYVETEPLEVLKQTSLFIFFI